MLTLLRYRNKIIELTFSYRKMRYICNALHLEYQHLQSGELSFASSCHISCEKRHKPIVLLTLGFF
nr:MAG TPA: hypothetical protein [Caudoviricetes sp.]